MSKVLLLINFCFLLLFSSCNLKDSPHRSPDTLELCASTDPLSFDPRIAGDGNSQAILHLLFEGLTRIEPDGKAYPAIAEEITVSKDRLTYTFYLKRTHWSNGEPLTAYDFENSWKKAISLDFMSKFCYPFYIIKNVKKYRSSLCSIQDVGIKAKSKEILEVKLENPAPYFLELIANPVFSPVHPNMNKKSFEWSFSSDFICNGPFKLKNWHFKKEFTLTKNPLYWNSRNVNLNRINLTIIPNNNTALLMFERGDIDWIGTPLSSVPVDSLPDLKSSNRLHIRPPCSVYLYICNTKIFPFNNPKLRKALSTAINRKDIVENFLEGNEIPALSILPPNLSLQQQDVFKDHDVKVANDCLMQALNELNISKEKLPEICLINNERDKIIPQIIQEQWHSSLGIKAKTQTLDWHSCLKKLMDNDFQLIGLFWESWISDPIYNLRYNEILQKEIDPQITQLLSLSDYEPNIQKRNQYLREAEFLLMDNMYIIPIYYCTDFSIKKNYVKGIYFTPLGNPDFTYARVETDLN